MHSFARIKYILSHTGDEISMNDILIRVERTTIIKESKKKLEFTQNGYASSP